MSTAKASMDRNVAERDIADHRDEERAWIEGARCGDMQAFRRLYDRHVDTVARQIGRTMGPGADAEDVVQEVFVAVHRSLDSFRGDSSFSTWLYRLTYNVTVSHLRKRPRTVDLAAWRPLKEPHSAWGRLEARDMVRVMYAALDNVAIEYREAFLLHEVEGLKLREISELTGESINTIAARVRRTRERLQEVLETAGGGHP